MKTDIIKLADDFYRKQDHPKEHIDIIGIMADFAIHFADARLKEAGQIGYERLFEVTVSVDDSDDLHDEILSLTDKFK